MAAEADLIDRAPVRRWKLNVDDYHRMAEAGILHDDDRVELIEGELIEMTPIGGPHMGTVNRLTHRLVQAASDRAIVSVQNPVRLDPHSEPQPDFALLRADIASDTVPTAADVLLLIEVADSSLRYDRTIKLPLYARHGIAEVWIVDVESGTVEIYREPIGDGYAAVARAKPGESVEPALLPGLRIAVADIVH
jgi:Uma2 family endonuclease